MTTDPFDSPSRRASSSRPSILLGRLDSFPLGAFDHWHVGFFGGKVPITEHVEKRSHGREVVVRISVCRGRRDAMLLSMLDVEGDGEWCRDMGVKPVPARNTEMRVLRVTRWRRGL